MYREITGKLEEWKEKATRKPLLLTGVAFIIWYWRKGIR